MSKTITVLRLGSAKRLTQSADKGSVQEPLNPQYYIPGT